MVTFGEITGRLAAPESARLAQALPGTLDVAFGGAEANTAVGLASLGVEVAFVTALPRHPIADACAAALRGAGVDTARIVRAPAGRLGLCYLEAGADQRAGAMVPDRDGAAMALTPAEAYDWEAIFDCVGWFHLTGITPGLSEAAAGAALAAVQAACEAEATVSLDLRYDETLWRWRPGTAPRDLAEETLRGLLPYVDTVIAGEEDAERVLGIAAEGSDLPAGRLHVEGYCDVAARIAEEYPNVQYVAITLRERRSASHDGWGAMLYDVDGLIAHLAPLSEELEYVPYEIQRVVDRAGSRDAFAAALIYAISTFPLDDPAVAVRFAAAASCLKYSTPGPWSFASRTDIEALMSGAASGRVNR